MYAPRYLTNQLLIAMPAMNDPNFYQTVTYICQHDDNGALGIIINRPLALSLGELLTQMDIAVDADPPVLDAVPVYSGGPVQAEQGFVVHAPQQDWDITLNVGDEIGVTTSRDVLLALARGRGPAQFFLALGYAGWGGGQLEQEIADNAWLSAPVDRNVLFGVPPEQRWRAAAALLGVDLSRLSGNAGHA